MKMAQSRLEAGTLARVHGLRTVAELNGSTVHLHKWDVVAQRWIVSLQDGSVKSIRPQNLLRLPSSRASFSSPPAHTEATGDASQSGAQFDREELKSLARQMLTDCEADQVLDALSTEELLELVQTLQTDASGGYPRGEETQPAASAANTQATSMSPERGGFQERLEHLELEEARVKSLVEAQSKLAKELEAREEALRLAEERLEQRRAEPPEAVAVKIPFVISDEESPALKAERAELQRLRDEVEATAREMEARQQAAKQQAKNFEERELQLLEEESAQLHAASALKEEEARLEMQRRSLGMLQQALLKGASEAKGPATGVTTEHSLDDETFNQHEETAAGASSGGDDEVWELDWSSAFGETRGTPETRNVKRMALIHSRPVDSRIANYQNFEIRQTTRITVNVEATAERSEVVEEVSTRNYGVLVFIMVLMLMVAGLAWAVWWLWRVVEELKVKIADAKDSSYVNGVSTRAYVQGMREEMKTMKGYIERIHRGLVKASGYVDNEEVKEEDWKHWDYIQRSNRDFDWRRIHAQIKAYKEACEKDDGPIDLRPYRNTEDEDMEDEEEETVTVRLDSGEVVEIPARFIEAREPESEAPAVSMEVTEQPGEVEWAEEDLPVPVSRIEDPTIGQATSSWITKDEFNALAEFDGPEARSGLRAKQHMLKLQDEWTRADREGNHERKLEIYTMMDVRYPFMDSVMVPESSGADAKCCWGPELVKVLSANDGAGKHTYGHERFPAGLQLLKLMSDHKVMHRLGAALEPVRASTYLRWAVSSLEVYGGDYDGDIGFQDGLYGADSAGEQSAEPSKILRSAASGPSGFCREVDDDAASEVSSAKAEPKKENANAHEQEVVDVADEAVLRLGGAHLGGYGESDVAYAYRQLARVLHPDKWQNEREKEKAVAASAFKRLSEAADELRQALAEQRHVLNTLFAFTGRTATAEMLERPQEAIFAEACRLLHLVSTTAGEGHIDRVALNRAAALNSQKALLLASEWFKKTTLLELFGGTSVRASYDCAPKRYRAQFLCLLYRLLLIETRQFGELSCRPAWTKILQNFPELALWQDFRERLQCHVWDNSSDPTPVEPRAYADEVTPSPEDEGPMDDATKAQKLLDTYWTPLTGPVFQTAYEKLRHRGKMTLQLGLMQLLEEATQEAVTQIGEKNLKVTGSGTPSTASGDRGAWKFKQSVELVKEHCKDESIRRKALELERMVDYPGKNGDKETAPGSLEKKENKLNEKDEGPGKKPADVEGGNLRIGRSSDGKPTYRRHWDVKEGERENAQDDVKRECAAWARPWRLAIAAILPSGADGVLPLTHPDLRQLIADLWFQEILTWSESQDSRCLGLFKADAQTPQTFGWAGRSKATRGLDPDFPICEWAFVPMSDLLLVVAEGIIGITSEGVFADNFPNHQRFSLEELREKVDGRS
ncbi:unnamed protein product [Durusdinium trenchii]|uniref:J domain-containing protein n=2 Tax=Durusdinium trenchii TaxID=1381693 RepID=A0ABP0IZI0_9DINO